MAFGESLYSRLSNNAGVTALAGTRIYPNNFKQGGTKPAVRYTRLSTVSHHLMGADANVETHTYQIDSIAINYADVDALHSAVKAALSRWREVGVVQDSMVGTVRDIYDSDVKMNRIQMIIDFFVEV